MKALRLNDLDECRHCGYAIAEGGNGWLHVKIGFGLSGARFCASLTVAEPGDQKVSG